MGCSSLTPTYPNYPRVITTMKLQCSFYRFVFFLSFPKALILLKELSRRPLNLYGVKSASSVLEVFGARRGMMDPQSCFKSKNSFILTLFTIQKIARIPSYSMFCAQQPSVRRQEKSRCELPATATCEMRTFGTETTAIEIWQVNENTWTWFNMTSLYFSDIYPQHISWLVVWNIFVFPYIGNNHPNWLSYFSEGLKPPTSFKMGKFMM